MNKILYWLCKVLNWILPVVLLSFSMNGQVVYWGKSLASIIIITYIIFGVVWGSAVRHGRSRLVYEIVIFIGMIFYLVVLYKRINWIGFDITSDYSELSIGTKAVLTLLSFLVIGMRIVVMIMGNAEYKAGSMDRQVRRVESAVEDARIKVKVAADNGSLHDIEKAKIELEEAKERRSYFYDEVKRDQPRENYSDTHRKKQSWEE